MFKRNFFFLLWKNSVEFAFFALLCNALRLGLHVCGRCHSIAVEWVCFCMGVNVEIEGTMLSAELFQTNKNKRCSNVTSSSFCGGALWSLLVSHWYVMRCVWVCMSAVDATASQLSGYVFVWVSVLKIEGTMLSAEFFQTNKRNMFKHNFFFLLWKNSVEFAFFALHV